MPLPDPHAGEKTQELDRLLFLEYLEAKRAVAGWEKELKRRKELLIKQLGDATAGTLDGEKVVAYRPKSQYAVGRLIKDYPDLTAHFFKHKINQVFDVEAFSAQHEQIAEQYRVRAFVDTV